MKTLLLCLATLVLYLPAQAQPEPFETPVDCELVYVSDMRLEMTVSWDSLDVLLPRYGGAGAVTMADSTGGGCRTFRTASLDSTLQRFVNLGILTNGVRVEMRQNLKAVIDTLTAASERWRELPHRHNQ